MLKITSVLKKVSLMGLVLALGLAIFPITGASAAGLNDQAAVRPANFRLEKLWAREQFVYQREGAFLTNASTLIGKVQTLIDTANSKGWDTSSVQSALDALSAVIPAVQAAHDPGESIIASHTGFDTNGTVTDRTTAIATVKSLGQVLKDTRTAMNGTGKALHDAVKAFREAHPRPAATPAE